MDLELQMIYECIIFKKMTLRETAAHCGLPKSTVHLLIHRNLKKESRFKYEEVQKVLDYNKLYRSGRRGGKSL